MTVECISGVATRGIEGDTSSISGPVLEVIEILDDVATGPFPRFYGDIN